MSLERCVTDCEIILLAFFIDSDTYCWLPYTKTKLQPRNSVTELYVKSDDIDKQKYALTCNVPHSKYDLVATGNNLV